MDTFIITLLLTPIVVTGLAFIIENAHRFALLYGDESSRMGPLRSRRRSNSR